MSETSAKKVEVAATAEREHSLSPTWVHLVKVAPKLEHMATARPPKGLKNVIRGADFSVEIVTKIYQSHELDVWDKMMTNARNMLLCKNQTSYS